MFINNTEMEGGVGFMFEWVKERWQEDGNWKGRDGKGRILDIGGIITRGFE